MGCTWGGGAHSPCHQQHQAVRPQGTQGLQQAKPLLVLLPLAPAQVLYSRPPNHCHFPHPHLPTTTAFFLPLSYLPPHISPASWLQHHTAWLGPQNAARAGLAQPAPHTPSCELQGPALAASCGPAMQPRTTWCRSGQQLGTWGKVAAKGWESRKMVIVAAAGRGWGEEWQRAGVQQQLDRRTGPMLVPRGHGWQGPRSVGCGLAGAL